MKVRLYVMEMVALRWVTGEVTAESDPRNVPHESQAKIREFTESWAHKINDLPTARLSPLGSA